jgi:hypothetical protein
MCASGDGKRSKHAKNKLKKLCIVGVNAKVKVQLTTSKTELNPQVPPVRTCSYKRSRNKLNCEFVNFSTVYLYIILLDFCAKWHWFGHIVAT